MSLRTYTLPVSDSVRLRHDAQARITVRSGRRVLSDRLTAVDTIGGAITVAAFTYNAASYSGGVSWWDPATGKPIKRPTYTVRVRPEDVLTGDQLCPCPSCCP